MSPEDWKSWIGGWWQFAQENPQVWLIAVAVFVALPLLRFFAKQALLGSKDESEPQLPRLVVLAGLIACIATLLGGGSVIVKFAISSNEAANDKEPAAATAPAPANGPDLVDAGDEIVPTAKPVAPEITRPAASIPVPGITERNPSQSDPIARSPPTQQKSTWVRLGFVGGEYSDNEGRKQRFVVDPAIAQSLPAKIRETASREELSRMASFEISGFAGSIATCSDRSGSKLLPPEERPGTDQRCTAGQLATETNGIVNKVSINGRSEIWGYVEFSE